MATQPKDLATTLRSLPRDLQAVSDPAPLTVSQRMDLLRWAGVLPSHRIDGSCLYGSQT